MAAKAPATIVPVPNKPKTPVSTFRIPLGLKAEAKIAAEELGTDLTAIVVKALEDAVKKAKKKREAA